MWPRRPAWGTVVPCASSRGLGMWWEPGVGSVLSSWGLGSAGLAPGELSQAPVSWREVSDLGTHALPASAWAGCVRVVCPPRQRIRFWAESCSRHGAWAGAFSHSLWFLGRCTTSA